MGKEVLEGVLGGEWRVVKEEEWGWGEEWVEESCVRGDNQRSSGAVLGGDVLDERRSRTGEVVRGLLDSIMLGE